MRRFSDEGNSALYDVDESSNGKGADEHHGDVQHRSRSGGTGDDDEETDRIGERERAEVTGCVRDVAMDIGGEEVRGGQDNDLHGDDGEQPPRDERAGPAVLGGSCVRDGSAEAGQGGRDADAGPSPKIVDLFGERSALDAVRDVCVDDRRFDLLGLAVCSSRERCLYCVTCGGHWCPPGALSCEPAVWDHSLVPSDRILREVVARAVEGDATAFVEFVALTESDVWKLCHALGSDGDVEDLVQETYLRAIRSIGSFRGDARVMAWLMRIGRNVCADHVRIRQRERGLVERLGPQVRDVEWIEPSFASDLLAGLARPNLEAFVLTQMLDMSYEMAAVVLDCPVGTVRSRLFRARQELARRHDRSSITG